MTFTRYWTILVKQWKIVVICMVMAALGSYIVSRFMTPIYQSAVIVQITLRSDSNGNQSDYNSLLASNQLVQTESELAISEPVLKKVAAHYPGLTTDQLVKEVSSSIKLNTQLFVINVQDASPTRAAVLANDIATTLISQQLLLTQQDNSRAQQQIQQDLDTTRQQIDATTSRVGQLQAQENAILEVQREAAAQAQTHNLFYQQDPQQVKQVEALNGQIAVLQAQLTRLQQHYNQWQTALAQLELTEAQSGSFLRVVQPAQVNPSPVRPQTSLYAGGGLLAGLLLGMLLAVLIEQLDTHIRTPEALTQLLDLPVLATMWKTHAEAVVNPGNGDMNIEAYRILRGNIGFTTIDKPLRSLLITSSLPREGKSVTAANLAIIMAKAGKNTLLIDADWHRPTLHEKFGLAVEKQGLSNAVVAVSQLQFFSPVAFVQEAQTSPFPIFSLEPFMHEVAVPNLRVMPAGPLPPSPSELLASKAMERLFVAIANCGAEMVIFDAPPLLGLSDTSILASKVDGTLIIVDATRANEKNLKRVKALLMQAGAHIIGCVINKQDPNRKDDAYYYVYTEEQPTEMKQNGNNGQPRSFAEVVRRQQRKESD